MNNALNTIKEVRKSLSGSSRDWAGQIVLDKMIEIIEDGIQADSSVEELLAKFRSNRMIASSRNRIGEAQAWDAYVGLFNDFR